MGWWQRRSRRARFALGLATVLATVVGWLAVGALRVLTSVDDYAAYWRRRSVTTGDLLYIALGDSAAQGLGASSPDRGYVGIVADRLAEATGRTVAVVNLSLSGAKVDDLTRQLAQLEELPPPDLVTLAIGANDAGRTEPARFRALLEDAVARLPAGAFVADVPDFGGGGRLEAARELAAVAREVVTADGRLRPVALERATRAMGWSDYARDFFHPGDSGYAIWAGAFWDAIAPTLEADAGRTASDGARSGSPERSTPSHASTSLRGRSLVHGHRRWTNDRRSA